MIEVQPDLHSTLRRRFAVPAEDARVRRTAAALEANGITVLRARNSAEAKRIVLDLIPAGSHVHQGASQSLEAAGITDEIERSGRYEPLRPRVFSMDRATQADEIRRLGASPEIMLGRVHAVTETGSLVAASVSGSQLGPYVSGAGKVILLVGTQKIVPDLEAALRRIDEYASRSRMRVLRLRTASTVASTKFSSSTASGHRTASPSSSAMSRWVSSNALIDTGCRDRRGQPGPGLGRHRTHPGPARATEPRDPGTQRAQRGFRAPRRRTVRGGEVFSDHEQLLTQPDVDVVAITVKVPHHRELVSAALDAGKAVYCEWPLGRDHDDARAMAALAAKQGAPTVIGLQARQARAIEFVLELLRDGYVGEVLSTTMMGLSVPGNVVGQPNAYMLDKTNGANLLTIGHSLDTLNYDWANSPTCRPCRIFADHSSPSKRPGSRS